MKLILHPGHSKCGSTTIQSFLKQNRQQLRVQGYLLPDVNFRFPFESKYRANAVATPRPFFAQIQRGELPIAEFEKRVDALIAGAAEHNFHTVIISAENLINGVVINNSITQQIMKTLAQKFSTVSVIYYVRRQDELFSSAWQEWGHKEGLTCSEYIKRLMQSKMGDFLSIANIFCRIFGSQSVYVRPINSSYLVKNDLICDFCTASNIDDGNFMMSVPAKNKGISLAICEILMRINDNYQNESHQYIKDKLEHLSKNSDDILYRKYRNFLSHAVYNNIVKEFNSSNIKLKAKFFPNYESSKFLYDEGEHEVKELDDIKEQVEQLKDVIALQMDMIFELSKH